MSFWLPTTFVNVISQFSFYRNAERIYMDPALVALKFHRAAEVDWSSSSSSGNFLSSDFAIGTVQGFLPERIAPMNRQNVDDAPVILGATPAIDVNGHPCVAHKPISEIEHDYRRCRVVSDGDESPPADVQAELVNYLDDIFAPEAFSEGDGGASATADQRSDIVTALA